MKNILLTLFHVYLNKLHELLVIPDGTEFPIYVFEKPGPNTFDPNITKDGIHIIIGILMDSTLQFMLRSLILDEVKAILNDLPIVNDIKEIVDISVSRGTQGWQMYGSRKPGKQAYKLVKYFNAEWEGGEWSDLDEVDLDEYEPLDLLLKVSARNKDHITYEIKDSILEQYEKKKKKKKMPKKPICNRIPSKITNKTELQNAVKAFLEGLKSDEYNIREIHDYTMILPEKYYNNYDEWLRVGFALHNIDYRLFLVWILFSSQSDKFKYDNISEDFERWEGMRSDGLTGRSIMYWAREGNPVEYKKIYSKTLDYYIDRSITQNTDHNSALVLYKMFEGKFICASI